MKDLITQGIVIKAIEYGDKDKIITIFTQDYGKQTAILKGVKKANAKLKFASLPFCFAQFKLVGRSEIATVAGATEIENFFDITQNYNKTVAGCAVLEMTNFVSNEQPNHILFSALLRALKELAFYETEPILIATRFALGVFKITGYQLNLQKCNKCGKSLASDMIKFDNLTGELICAKCSSGNSLNISSRTLEVLQNISKLEFDQMRNIVVTDSELNEFKQIVKQSFLIHYGKKLQSF